MKNPKAKGSKFERAVCTALSLYVTNGARTDVFWRSAMSGGRATVRGLDVRQAGDIAAVAPEGHSFCERYYVECKHLQSLDLHGLLTGTGKLVKFWKDTRQHARKRGQDPVLIARQNRLPTILCCHFNDTSFGAGSILESQREYYIRIHLFECALLQPYLEGKP